MDLLAALTERTPAGIAATIGQLVRSGDLPVGTRLPTVREVAASLQVSPGTVSAAWHALSDAGLVRSRGRAGTFVLAQTTTWLPPRYRDLASGAQVPYRLDLSSGTPDPQLLPALGPAFATLARRTAGATTSSYLGPPVLPPLESRLRAAWPFAPEALTVVDGALDGMSRTLDVLVGLGSRVAIEDPCFPPLLDLLDSLGVQRVGVGLDEHGLLPDELWRALDARCDVVVLQPRAQNPTGASMTSERARELARVLHTHPHGADVVVVEDDHSGAICQTADVSLGTYLAGRVVHVHSYSKSHGPDLRIAAVGGPARVLERVVARRMLGPGWTSRMLQSALLELLTDRTTQQQVAGARDAYRRRQREVARAVEASGGRLRRGDGLNMWLPVADERAALVSLAAQGVRAAPGSPFRVDAPGPGEAHLRISVGSVRDAFDALGTALAAAAQA